MFPEPYDTPRCTQSTAHKELMYPRLMGFTFSGFQSRRLPLSNVVRGPHRSVTAAKFESLFHPETFTGRRGPVAPANGQMGIYVTPLINLISAIKCALRIAFFGWDGTGSSAKGHGQVMVM